MYSPLHTKTSYSPFYKQVGFRLFVHLTLLSSKNKLKQIHVYSSPPLIKPLPPIETHLIRPLPPIETHHLKFISSLFSFRWWFHRVKRFVILSIHILITKIVSSNPIHGEVYSIQHYVIKFVSDLRQVHQ